MSPNQGWGWGYQYQYEIKSSFLTIWSKNRNYLLKAVPVVQSYAKFKTFEKSSWFPKNYELTFYISSCDSNKSIESAQVIENQLQN